MVQVLHFLTSEDVFNEDFFGSESFNYSFKLYSHKLCLNQFIEHFR